MSRSNWAGWDSSRDQYMCFVCDAMCCSERCLHGHCREDHEYEWCEQCKVLFESPSDLDAHFRNSARHWVCHLCRLDFCCEKLLVDHETKLHFRCGDCKKTFSIQNDLIMVGYRSSAFLCDGG